MRRIMILAAMTLIMILPPAAFAQEETASTATAEAAATPTLTVEAQVCTAVEERVPVGAGSSFPSTVAEVCLWSKIIGAVDSTSVRHIFVYKGEEVLNREVAVKSAAWRTWSCKTMMPQWTGQWEAKIVGPDGTVLATVPFTVEEAPAETPATETPTAPEEQGQP